MMQTARVSTKGRTLRAAVRTAGFAKGNFAYFREVVLGHEFCAVLRRVGIVDGVYTAAELEAAGVSVPHQAYGLNFDPRVTRFCRISADYLNA